MVKKDLLSTSEAAKLLGISRVAVFKKIKSGEINAKKVGRNFVIDKSDLPETISGTLSDAKKKTISDAVSKVVSEYRETLRLLGQE